MKTLIVTTLILLTLSGCGLRLTYPHLDWLIPFYVDDYISLNQEQSSLLGKRLEQVLDWHCSTQLPAYTQMLKDVVNDLEDRHAPLDIQKLRFYAKQINSYWHELKIQLGLQAADVLMTASDEQLAQLLQNVEKNNTAFKREYVDVPPATMKQKRSQSMARHVHQWLSELTPMQKQAIDDWSAHIKPLAADRLFHRQRILADFENLLVMRSNAPNFKTVLLEWLVNLDQRRTPAYQEKIGYNANLTLELLDTLSRSLTAGQRAYLVKRIDRLVADFDKLSCGPSMALLSLPRLER
jgi:hypothetical protein